MSGIGLLSREVVSFRVKNPSNHRVVDRDPEKRAKHLREEHIPRRHVHVVSDLHVLQIELGPIPGVAL